MSAEQQSTEEPKAIEFNPDSSGVFLQKIELDGLGPVVINENGSISRITNWHQMTSQEQEITQRVIAKRNKSRLEKLKEKETFN